MSEFSSRGKEFGPIQTPPTPTPQVHATRVKPDVVAPGWLIEGPRRTASCYSGPCGGNGFDAETIPGPPVYAYGRGTSFATPAVSGALAQSAKQLRAGRPGIYPPWMQNGVVPSPSLLKAGLIATARSLGPVDPLTQAVTCTGGDCRPSKASGWGLVDLDRLTNTAVPVFVRNEQTDLEYAGDSWTSPPLVRGVAGQEVPIALVWSDVPGPFAPAEALQRDLDLKVTSSGIFWVGNNFTENLTGVDSGYSASFGIVDNSLPDRVNNVETVFLQPTALIETQSFRIVVQDFAHGLSADYPDQPFSIYAWNVECRYSTAAPPNGAGTCLQN